MDCSSPAFDEVPVVEVTKDNIKSLFPSMRSVILDSDLIAMDCELSGLGDRKKLNASSIEDRYENLCRVAMTRSIISIGVSVFKQESVEKGTFHCQTYNIVVLCQEDYIVEPQSLNFLVQHGFDFGKQYGRGLPYKRGCVDSDQAEELNHLRELFNQVVRSKKKIVFHNGFIDIVFLYQNLYAQVPQTLRSFLADVSELFSGGIFDTKYVAEYVARMPASYLEYVFRRTQMRNLERASVGQPHVNVVFPKYPSGSSDFLEYRSCKPKPVTKCVNGDDICQSYSNHGHCVEGNRCVKSHDIDLIIAHKDRKKRKRVGEVENQVGEEEEEEEAKAENGEERKVTSGSHRAGFDAFMTGFSFIAFLSHDWKGKAEEGDCGFELSSLAAGREVRNAIYLSCKTFPLIVQKSPFSKNSASHADKYRRIMCDDDAGSMGPPQSKKRKDGQAQC